MTSPGIAAPRRETFFPRLNLHRKLRGLPWLTMVLLFVIVGSGVFAPLITPYSPLQPELTNRLAAPSVEHILGTDSLGRDLFTRVIYGTRSTFTVVLLALGIGAAIGTMLGLVAGYFRGVVDIIVSRLIDSVLAFPSIFFGLLLAVTSGAGLQSVVVAISIVLWARFARVIRGEVLSIRERDFIAQAKVNGCSRFRILLVHVLPNVVSPLMVLLSINLGYVITLEASLSFLGAGIPAPTPSWGGIVAEGQNYIGSAWWITVVPGIAIVLTVLAVNLLGDWVRDRLDPKMQDRP